jgi:hypothetical protein
MAPTLKQAPASPQSPALATKRHCPDLSAIFNTPDFSDIVLVNTSAWLQGVPARKKWPKFSSQNSFTYSEYVTMFEKVD